MFVNGAHSSDATTVFSCKIMFLKCLQENFIRSFVQEVNEIWHSGRAFIPLP